MAAAALAAGFADPVRDSQAVFRAVMDALARPGRVQTLAASPERCPRLPLGSAAVALTLTDFETPVWLGPSLAGDEAVTTFLRFHTGAPLVADPSVAAFAFLAPGEPLPPLEGFALGSAEYPDRSTTLVVPVDTLVEGTGWRLRGPGIEGDRRLSIGPLPADMPARLAANRALFPRGIDLVFVAGNRIAALPRTTLVEA